MQVVADIDGAVWPVLLLTSVAQWVRLAQLERGAGRSTRIPCSCSPRCTPQLIGAQGRGQAQDKACHSTHARTILGRHGGDSGLGLRGTIQRALR